MSKRVAVELVDDLDGQPIEDGAGGGTVHFALQEHEYELDLSAANIAKLEELSRHSSRSRTRRKPHLLLPRPPTKVDDGAGRDP